MKKTFLRKYWIILTSACCLATAIGLACAGDYGEEYGTSNFTPEIFVDTTYSPFFYSWQFYYGIGHDENYINRFNNSNVKEWSVWLGKAIQPATIDYLLNTAAGKSVDSALSAPVSDKKMKAFLEYLRMAKKCEDFSLTSISRWDLDTTKKKLNFDVTALNRQLQDRLTAAPDAFLQERYWFQLVRSLYFNGKPGDVVRTFDTYAQKFPLDKLYYRSLAYMAGAYYKQKEYSKANYYYSLVYAGCDQLRTVAHFSFHPQEEQDWRGTLALCRNKDQQATLWQMLGIFYSDPARAIEEIYRLDPKSDKLDLLLVRAVNQIEQKFSSFQTRLPGFDMMPEQKDSSNKTIKALIGRIADAGNTARPWAWQLAAGYLNTLDRRYPIAAGYFTKAETTTPKDPRPQAQLRLLKLINTLASARTIDAALEQRLYPEIEWLGRSQADHSFRNNDAFEWVKKVMAAKYRLSGNIVKAECFSTRPAFYTNNNNVESLKAFLNKPDKTPYENFIGSLCPIKRTDLFEYQAIRLCFNDHTDEAIQAMQQSEPGKAQITLPANPFNGRINDCHDCDQAAPQKIKYSKIGLLNKLKELKEKIAAGQDVYTNAILFANAQYNITYYGNNRSFYECAIIGSGGIWSIDSVYQAPITDMKIAIKYYALALSAASNDEQKAKCQYLLAKCQRNEWYNKIADSRNPWAEKKESQPDFIAWDGFKSLKQYANTKYYSEVLKECGYFSTYIQKAH